MVDTPQPPFDEDVWELYDHAADWSQARDLAAAAPRAAARAAGAVRAGGREAPRAPARRPGHRAREPGGGRPARPAPAAGHAVASGRGSGRLTEEAAPNVKNRSHVITADLEVVTGTNGVVVAQGGRFGGWSLYLVDGVPHYAYNFVGRDLTVVRGARADDAGAARPRRPVRLRRRPSRQRRRA